MCFTCTLTVASEITRRLVYIDLWMPGGEARGYDPLSQRTLHTCRHAYWASGSVDLRLWAALPGLAWRVSAAHVAGSRLVRRLRAPQRVTRASPRMAAIRYSPRTWTRFGRQYGNTFGCEAQNPTVEQAYRVRDASG